MNIQIKELIEREFNANVLKEEKINEGFSHHMYLVEIDREPFNVIIRFLNSKDEKFDLSKEEFIINKLKEAGLPVPKIYAFNERDGYMILEKFKGIRLDTIWDSLGKEEKIKITRKLGEILAKIHQINLEDFGYILSGGKIQKKNKYKFKKRGEEIPSSRFLKHLLSAFFEDIALFASYPEISKELLMKVTSYVLSKVSSLDYAGKPTLIHNDFMIGHVFVEKINNEYEITGIIDFEFAESSDPEYEFIKLHRQGFFDDSELKNALEEGYGRKINEEKLRSFRFLRDFSLARVLLDSGDKDYCYKILKEADQKINFQGGKNV
jgi:aminoglycoside phosphotransferase (APT) family kinase protein